MGQSDVNEEWARFLSVYNLDPYYDEGVQDGCTIALDDICPDEGLSESAVKHADLGQTVATIEPAQLHAGFDLNPGPVDEDQFWIPEDQSEETELLAYDAHYGQEATIRKLEMVSRQVAELNKNVKKMCYYMHENQPYCEAMRELAKALVGKANPSWEIKTPTKPSRPRRSGNG